MQCLIFDCDNTLFETLPLHWEKHVRALARAGIQVDPAWRPQIYHHNGRQNWQWLHENHGLNVPMADYLAEIDAWYLDRVQAAPMRAGIAAVLEQARALNLPMAVASSARRKTVEGLLAAHDLRWFFDVVVTGDDVTHTKPDPALYQTALAGLFEKRGKPMDPARSIAIDDDPLGIMAAKAAGLRVIHYRLCLDQDWAEGADFRVDTGEELLAAVQAALKS